MFDGKCKIKDLSRTLDNQYVLTLMVPPAVRNIYDRYKEKDLRLKLCLWREKRSLNANDFYWLLLERLSKAMETSKDELHELMLQRYGTFFQDNDGNIVTISSEVEIDPIASGVHCRFRGTSELNGKVFYHYYLIKGSRYYDSKEFSQLLNGAISEANEQGVETLSERELSLLKL